MRTPEGLDQLRAGWLGLVDSSDPPTQHPAWTRAAATTIAAHKRLQVVGIGPPERPRALAPLTRARHTPGPWWQAGSTELKEPADLLYQDESAAEELVDALVDARMPLLLRRLPAGSAALKALTAAHSRRTRVDVRPDLGTPYIELDAGWTEPERRLSSSRRSALRRARRIATREHGEVTVAIEYPEPAALPALLDEAFAIEERSWKGRESTALAQDPRRGGFFRAYGALAAGSLQVAFLRTGDRAIAMQISVDTGTHLFVLKIGHDDEYARCSPGVLLTAALVADAAARGVQRYEFLGWPAPWIDAWTTDHHPLVAVTVSPVSASGLVAFTPERLRQLGRDAAAAGVSADAMMRPVTSFAAETVRPAVRSLGRPLIRRAARGYCAGPSVADALAVSAELADQGVAATIGYWDAGGEDPRAVRTRLVDAVDALAGSAPGAYLSLKAPAIGNDAGFGGEIAAEAARRGVDLHLDAMRPADVDPALKLLGALGAAPGVGTTIPGRWTRSMADVDRVLAADVRRVRVVKGQFADDASRETDPRLGYAAVIEALAGRARSVAVATHDAALARHAVTRLQAAGTDCEIELFRGLPPRDVLAVARELTVPVRVYVPFGHPSLPYAPSVGPRSLWWLAKDAASGGAGGQLPPLTPPTPRGTSRA